MGKNLRMVMAVMCCLVVVAFGTASGEDPKPEQPVQKQDTTTTEVFQDEAANQPDDIEGSLHDTRQAETASYGDDGYSKVFAAPAQTIRGVGFSSSVVYGVTDFILARAKEEFAAIFLEDMLKRLEQPRDTAIAKLFPHTKSMLVIGKDDITQLFPIGNNMRTVLQSDLEELPGNIISVLRASDKKNCSYAIMDAGWIMYQDMRAAVPLKKLLLDLKRVDLSSCASIDIGEYNNVIDDLVDLVKTYEASPEAVMKFPQNNNGLFFTLQDIQTTAQNSFLGSGSRINDDRATFQRYVSLVLQLFGELKKSTFLSDGTIDMIDVIESALRDIWSIAEPITTQEYARAAVATSSVIAQQKLFDDSRTALTAYKYLSFAASMTSARTPEEARKALEAAALPVGSYRVKQKRTVWSLNAFAGACYASEYTDLKINSRPVGSVAPMVSLGISCSWKLRNKGLFRYGGLYLQTLDLGAVASYRIKTSNIDQEDIAQAPEVGFDQIFAPGLFGYLSLGKGVVVGAGANLAPRLRELKADEIVKRKSSVLQVGGFLAIDIPVFAF